MKNKLKLKRRIIMSCQVGYVIYEKKPSLAKSRKYKEKIKNLIIKNGWSHIFYENITVFMVHEDDLKDNFSFLKKRIESLKIKLIIIDRDMGKFLSTKKEVDTTFIYPNTIHRYGTQLVNAYSILHTVLPVLDIFNLSKSGELYKL
jgi:hypothetical protein